MYHTHLGKAGMKWWCQSFKAAMLVRVNNAWWVNFSSKLSNASSSICDNNNGTICWNKKHSNKEKIQSLGLHSFMLPPFLFDYLHLRTN